MKPYYTEPEVMELGVTAIPFAGGEMKIYEKERLICDCLKYEERLEREDLKKALLAFINEPKKDYCKINGICQSPQGCGKGSEQNWSVAVVAECILRESLIRQRSEDLQIPFVDLLPSAGPSIFYIR